MPTLLVTRRMSPELAARVQAAVSGKSHVKVRSRVAGLLRLVTFVTLVAGGVGVVHFRRQNARELEAARSSLLSAMQRAGSGLTRADKDLKSRVEAAIALHTTPAYAGDSFASDLRSEPELARALALPTLYLRGSLGALANAGRLGEVAASCVKDAFVLCLLDPPESRSEKALRAKASTAYTHGKGMQVAAHVEPVAPLLQALPLVGPAWQERARAAETLGAVQALQTLFDAAPVQAAVRSAKARQLLLVMDEAGTTKGPTELDGERAHPIRVVLSDLSSNTLRLRFRADADPSWLSDSARAQLASGIDSCALAVDLRKALTSAR